MAIAQLMDISAGKGRITLKYVAEGYATIELALAAVIAAAPATFTWNGVPEARNDADISATNATDDAAQANDYMFDVPYGSDPGGTAEEQANEAARELEAGGTVISFSVGGGTVHITTGTYVTSIGSVPTPERGVINASKDGVEGVDIPDNKVVFSLKKQYASAPTGLAATLSALVGKTNDAIFQGAAIGEVLFIGANASDYVEGGPLEITYSFAWSRDATVTVPTIGPIAKKGWEYLSLRFTQRRDTGELSHTPAGAQTIKIFEQGDFSVLGL